MHNKDDNAVLKRIESIFENPRYASNKKLSTEHMEELKKAIRSNEAVAFVLSGLCDAFDKAQNDANGFANCLVDLVQMHQFDLEKGNERMAYIVSELEMEEAKLKCVN